MNPEYGASMTPGLGASLTEVLRRKDYRIQAEMIESQEDGLVLKLHLMQQCENMMLSFSPAFFVTVRQDEARSLRIDTLTYNEEIFESRRFISPVSLLNEDITDLIVADLNRSHKLCSGLSEDKLSCSDIDKVLIEKYNNNILYRSRKCFRIIKDGTALEGRDLTGLESLCPPCLCISDLGLKLEERITASADPLIGENDEDSLEDLPSIEEDDNLAEPSLKKTRKRQRIERLPCLEPNCGRSFKSEKAMLKHANKMHSEGTIRCPLPECGKLFKEGTSDRRMVQHLLKMHPEKQEAADQYLNKSLEFRCKSCDENQGSLPILLEHERGCKQSATCELCGQVYSSASTLKVHKKTIHSDECFVCDEPGCGKRVKTKASLLDHKASVHRNQKAYMCHGCGKEFRYRHQRRMCENKHMGKFIHPCNLCDKKFNDKRRFDQHMRVHTGEKPFTCPICNFRCARLDNLNLHTKKSHGVTWKEAETMTGISVRSKSMTNFVGEPVGGLLPRVGQDPLILHLDTKLEPYK